MIAAELSQKPSAIRMRRKRDRDRIADIPAMIARSEPGAIFLPRAILEAWAKRGLHWFPRAKQVALIAPLTREPTGRVSSAAIAAMEEYPPVGSTYPMVGSMVKAAREALQELRKRLHPYAQDMEPSTPERDDAETSAHPGDPGGDPGARHPIGLAAWAALRAPGGALYRGPADQLSDAAPERMAGQRVYMRHVRAARRRSLP